MKSSNLLKTTEKNPFIKRIILLSVFLLQISFLFSQNNFSFIYLPDLHLEPDSAVLLNFEKLASNLNKLRPDFIITGGDQIYTAKNGDEKNAAMLFDLMDRELKLLKMPVYLTMGNHEHVGITELSSIDNTNPYWGKRMFEKRYGNPFYSFIYEGWKFIILDGIRILEKEKDYTQGIDSTQVEWIREELRSTEKTTPIVISVHTPFINPHAMTDSGSRALSKNSEFIISLFKDHDLRIVLQGHNHIFMSLFTEGIHYISGGSTAFGTDTNNDGYVMVTIKNNKEYFKFIPTGSTVREAKQICSGYWSF